MISAINAIKTLIVFIRALCLLFHFSSLKVQTFAIKT